MAGARCLARLSHSTHFSSHPHTAARVTLRETPFCKHTFIQTLQRRTQTTYAGVPPPPPRPARSLPVRILWTTSKYLFFGTLFFAAGAFIGLESAPQGPALLALMRKPPTDAETLTLFSPDNAYIASINDKIVNHPLAQSLRANSAYTESRPHMKIPKELRPTNLTGGTLAGPGRIAVPPVVFSEAGGKSMVSIFYLGDQLCGHPGLIHGGLLATLLDEGLARCCFPALPNRLGVTANLKIDYRKPARAGGLFVLKAETIKVEGRKAWVKGWIESLDREGMEGVKLVEAEALFVEPRNANMMKRLYAD